MNKNIFKLTIFLTSVRALLFLGLIIWGIISVVNSIGNQDEGRIGKTITICFCFIFLFVIYALMSLSLILNYIYSNNQNNRLILVLSILTLNIELLIKSSKEIRFTTIIWRFKRWTVFDLTAVGVLLALYFTLGFITSLIPKLPFYIELTFKYIPLFFGAFILSLSSSIVLCFLAATLTVLLPGLYISFWQFVFDYWIPAFCIFLAGFFAPQVKANNWFVKIGLWFSFVTIPVTIIYFSRVTSGVVYWLNPNKLDSSVIDLAKEFKWSNNVGYSFIYNSINTIFDYVMLMICIPITCESLWVIKERFFYTKDIKI